MWTEPTLHQKQGTAFSGCYHVPCQVLYMYVDKTFLGSPNRHSLVFIEHLLKSSLQYSEAGVMIPLKLKVREVQ